MRRGLHSLSLPSLKVLHHSNTRVLERHASSNCFSSLWRISKGWTSSAITNLIIMHCSTLTYTFCSLISLVELRQDWTSAQQPEQEGREATSSFLGQLHSGWDFTLVCTYSWGLRTCQHLRSLAPVMSDDDYDGQMIFGDLVRLKLPDICLTGEEKPRNNLTQETCSDRGSNPGLLRDRCVCYHLSHSGELHARKISVSFIFKPPCTFILYDP